MKSIYSFILTTCLLLISLTSCRKDFDFEPSTGSDLRFSKDTVYLDTIFTNIGSSTYQLKVYNTSNKDIKIPKIELKKGQLSHYRLMVDGIAGKSFQNVELLAKDSMYIFIETTVDIQNETQNPEFLYTDELLFSNGSTQQQVNLVTLIKDAIFLYPQKFEDGTTETLPIGDEKIYGFYLDENDAINGNELHWKAGKPYVIYGYAAVPPEKTLQVDAGAQIHFHSNSGLIVGNSSTLHIQGSSESPVLIQGDRLEPSYEDVPGQWDQIWMAVGSKGSIEHAIIKNAKTGLFINKNATKIQLNNLQIYNCSQYGILARAAEIQGSNIATNNIGNSALALTYGGSYEFVYCTFTNYWNRPSHTSVSIDNFDGSAEFAIQKAHFVNSIIYSGSSESLILKPHNQQPTNFHVRFDHSLIKFIDYNQQVAGQFPYDFQNQSVYSTCLVARNSTSYLPYFLNVQKNKMMITEKALDLINFGTSSTPFNVPFDLAGKPRNATDIGAYIHVNSTEE